MSPCPKDTAQPAGWGSPSVSTKLFPARLCHDFLQTQTPAAWGATILVKKHSCSCWEEQDIHRFMWTLKSSWRVSAGNRNHGVWMVCGLNNPGVCMKHEGTQKYSQATGVGQSSITSRTHQNQDHLPLDPHLGHSEVPEVTTTSSAAEMHLHNFLCLFLPLAGLWELSCARP